MATSTEHAATRIQLCGEFVVAIDGRRVDADISGRQGRTLLAYLVLHRRRPIRREELIEALWPDATPASPESALNTIVSRLRKVLGHGLISGRSELKLELAEGARVDFESAFDDIEQAEQALERSAWGEAASCAEAALRIAGGGFVPEVDADWAQDERRRLEEVRLRALECLAACGLALGGARLSATEGSARQLIETAPYRETGYCYLMQALAERGRVAEALRVFDGVRVLLQAELGVAPSAELRALHERLLIRPPTETERSPQPLALPAAFAADERTQVVGRDRELERLWGLYEQARSGTCRTAVICGDPGIGKTRLAAELARRVHRERGVALYGRCDEEPLVAHQPFVEALEHYVAVCPPARLVGQLGPGGGELRRLVPALGRRLPALPEPVSGDPDGERYRLFEAVGTLLRQAAEASPLVLVLDDLHWADKPTLLLLRHLVRHTRPPGLLVLGTYRDAEVEPAHALRDALADLGGAPGCRRLSLGPLEVAAVEELVRSEAGEQPPELVRMLCDETEGNPFFLGEMLRHLAESGRLSGEREQQAIRPSELGIPEGVKDVIGRRIGRLDQRTKAVLATASVCGRTFEFAILEHLSGREQDELLDALDEAVRAGLIAEAPDAVGRYTFTHALIRETVYDGLMRTRRALLHRRMAATLEELHAGDLDARSAQLAHHLGHAGAPADIAKAIEYAGRAGDVALDALAYEQAAEHYRQALRLLDQGESSAQPALRCDLLIARGAAERQAGDVAYRRTLLDGARLAQEIGDAGRLARAALANNRGFFSAAAEVDSERVAVLGAALDAHGVRDSATRASLLAQLAVELVADRDFGRRVRLSDEALAMARRVGEPGALARTLNHRYVALWGPRTLSERIASTREATELAGRLEDPALSFQCARFESHAAMEAGDLELADRRLECARALAEQLGQPIIHWYYAVTRAKRASITDSPAEAEARVRDAYEIGRRVGQPDAALWQSLGLFVTGHLQGTLAVAAHASLPTPPGEAPPIDVAAPRSRSVALLNAAVRAAMACEAGRGADARAHFEELMCHELADLSDGWTALAVAAVAAVACTQLGDVRRAQTLFAMLEPYAGRFVDAGPAWFGAVSHHLAGLALTLEDRAEADAYFADAARAYGSLHATPWLARLQIDRRRLKGV